MSDVQFAVLALAGALGAWYLRSALARESSGGGLLEARAAGGGARSGLRAALLGHALSLAMAAPVLVHFGFDRPSGSWLSSLFWLWARFAGAAQLVYLVPLALAASREGRTGEVQGLSLAGRITAAFSVLLWSLDFNRMPSRSVAAPAAAGVAAIGCVLYLFLLFARLRRILRG